MSHSTVDERMALRQAQPDHLAQTAERLFPDNTYLQAEWCRAVDVVRSTKSGWKLDNPVPRKTEAAAH